MPKDTKRNRYTGTDLVKGLSHLEGISEAKAKSVLDHVIEQIVLALLRGDKVYLPKLGSFHLVLTRPKEGVHPKTLDPLVVKPSLKARFGSSITLTDLVKAHVPTFLERKLGSMTEKELREYWEHSAEVDKRVSEKQKSREVSA